MNEQMKRLSSKYKMNFIDYDITDDMIEDTIELNERGHIEIYKNLSKSLKETLFGT